METRRAGSKVKIVLLLCAACALGVLSAGKLSNRYFSGFTLNQVVSGDISPDSWVGEVAHVEISGFFAGVNSLRFEFGTARPGASEPARVAISVCGQQEREFNLEKSSVVTLPTTFSCYPLSAKLRALNFFSPIGERVPRELGVQLISASVRSPVRVPVVQPMHFLLVCLVMICLVSLLLYVAQGAGLPGLPVAWLFLALTAFGMVSMKDDPERLLPVVVVLLGSLVGMSLHKSRLQVRASDYNRGGGALLWLALLVGAALRLYGIAFGLPSNFHPDEVPKVNAIMRMYDGGTLDPQYFLHPSLLLYLTYGTNKILHLFGIDGAFRDTAFLAGRLVSTAAGITSIWLTYCIASRLFSRQAGGIAALLLAVFPLHITCSRYLKEDALLTFIVLLCVLVTVIAVQTQRRSLLLLAGLLAGCTAGAKYSGILMIVVPASAPWMASRSLRPDVRWLPWAIMACLLSPAGFVLTTPYSVLNSAKFLHDFAAESRHMQTGHTVTISAWSQLWMYHYWRSIWPGVSGLVAVVLCVACGFLLRRGRLEDLVVVGMALLFYLPAEYVKAKPAPQPERYILPCLPFIAIGVGEFIRSLGTNPNRIIRSTVPIAALLIVCVPFIQSANLAREVRNDTRDQLASWMKENLPHGSKVLMDWKPYCPNFHGEYFEVEHIPRARIITELDVAALRTSGANYLILSSLFYNRYFSQPETEPILRQRFREVFQRVPIISQFTAPSGPYGFHNPTLTLFSLSPEDFERLENEREMKKQGAIAFTSNDVKAQAKW